MFLSRVHRNLATLAGNFSIVISLLALCSQATVAASFPTEKTPREKPVMNWMILDFAPFSKPVNGKLTDGSWDAMLKLVAKEWPEVEHHYTVGTPARAFADMADGQETCLSGALTNPEREKIAYFSFVQLNPPIQLVVRPQTLPSIPRNEKGEVLPGTLLDNNGLQGLVVQKRAYGPVLDALIARAGAKANLYPVAVQPGNDNIYRMLAMGRGDWLLEHTAILNYTLSANASFYSKNPLVHIPIAGISTNQAGIACPRTAWGEVTIKKIDAVLTKIAKTPQYRAAMNANIDAGTLKHYKDEIDAFYRERTKVSAPDKFSPPTAAPLPNAAPAEKNVRLALYAWQPLIGETEGRAGLLGDIAVAALRKAGYTVQLQFMPFARAMQELQDGSIDMALAISQNEERRQFLDFSTSLHDLQQGFIFKKGRIAYRIPADLKLFRGGILRGSFWAKTLGELDVAYEEVTDQPINIGKLVAGRIDFVAMPKEVGYHLLKSVGEDTSQYQFAVLKTEGQSAAFSKRTRLLTLKDDFEKGLKAIKTDYTKDIILMKYK